MNITTNERALLEKIRTAADTIDGVHDDDIRDGGWVGLDYLPSSHRDYLTGLTNTASAIHVAPSLLRKGLIESETVSTCPIGVHNYRSVRLTEAGLDAAAGGDGTDVTSKENRQ
jgi:hypothetical protein